MNPSPSVKAFFDQYQLAGETLDLDHIALQYADSFMFAGPDGARVIETQKLLATLPQRQTLFKSLGHQWTRVLSLDETALDANHVVVQAEFLMRFKRPPDEVLDAQVTSSCILHVQDNAPRILFHLELEDVQQALKDRGWLT